MLSHLLFLLPSLVTAACFYNSSLVIDVGAGNALLVFSIMDTPACKLLPPQAAMNLSIKDYNITQPIEFLLSSLTDISLTISCPTDSAAYAECKTKLSAMESAKFTLFSRTPGVEISMVGSVPKITLKTFDYSNCWASMSLNLDFSTPGAYGFVLDVVPNACALAAVAQMNLTLVYGKAKTQVLILETTSSAKPYDHQATTKYTFTCKGVVTPPNCNELLVEFQGYAFRKATFEFLGNVTSGTGAKAVLVEERVRYPVITITGLMYNKCFGGSSLQVFKDHIVFYVSPPATPGPPCILPAQAATTEVFLTIYNVDNASLTSVFFNQSHVPFFSFNTAITDRYYFTCSLGSECMEQFKQVTSYPGNMIATYGFNFYNKAGNFIDTVMFEDQQVHKTCYALGSLQVYKSQETVCVTTQPTTGGNIDCSIPITAAKWNITLRILYNLGSSLNNVQLKQLGEFTGVFSYGRDASFCFTCSDNYVTGSDKYLDYKCPALLKNLQQIYRQGRAFGVVTISKPGTSNYSERVLTRRLYFLDYEIMWIIFAVLLGLCGMGSMIYTVTKIRKYQRGILS